MPHTFTPSPDSASLPIRVENWEALPQTARYHAGVIARWCETNVPKIDWYMGVVSFTWEYMPGNDEARFRLAECLITALTHPEAKYAFRALLQVQRYAVKAEAHDWHVSIRAARSRVEGLLGF